MTARDTRRLAERFPPETMVELALPMVDGERLWVTAQVIGSASPGLWVRTADGRPWFVTNGSRIRSIDAKEAE